MNHFQVLRGKRNADYGDAQDKGQYQMDDRQFNTNKEYPQDV